MPRISLPRLETMSEAQRKVYEEIVQGPRGSVRGPLLAALYNPELADRWQRFGELLRYRTSIPARYTEMAILVTARAKECVFEWYVHEPPALQAGLEPEFIAAIRERQLPGFTDPVDRATYDFACELQTSCRVTSETYGRMLDRFSALGVVELTAVIGYYTMVAMTLNVHEFGLPDGVPDPF